jgi:hypothetical protein
LCRWSTRHGDLQWSSNCITPIFLSFLKGQFSNDSLYSYQKKHFLWGWLCSRQSVFQDLSKFVTARFSFIPCQTSLDGVVTTQTEGWLGKSLGWKRSPCGRHCEHIGLRHTICIRLRCLLKKRLTVHCEFRNVASNGEFTESQELCRHKCSDPWSLLCDIPDNFRRSCQVCVTAHTNLVQECKVYNPNALVAWCDVRDLRIVVW